MTDTLLSCAVDGPPIPDFTFDTVNNRMTSMQTRAMTSIPLLLLGAALLAGPAFAADAVAGAKGSADTGASRDAPFVLPGNPMPRVLPTVDATTLSRGPLALDPAAALDSMGTVTLARDGSVTEQPASSGMRAILEEEMKGSGKSAPGAAVIGEDDRAQITRWRSAGSGRRTTRATGRPAPAR
jgi:hypothetical protein